MKQTILSFLLVLLPLAVSADAVEINGIYYNLVSKSRTAEVTKRTSIPNNYTGIVTIPETVTYNDVTYNVTGIGNYAFEYCRGLTSVTIPNTVISIGYGAFEHCSGLTNIVIPNSVTNIGGQAFYKCSGLTSITIGNSVTSIDIQTFRGCNSLTSIQVAEHNGKYDSRDGCNAIIETATNSLIIGCKNTIIPNSVTNIGDDAFLECSGLTSITIPNSVTGIGSYAFYSCSGLTSVTIGSSVTSIGYDAFGNCQELTNVYSYATNVPSTTANIFQDSHIEYATLYVLESAIESYKATAPWSGFKNFVSIESEYLVIIGPEGFATSCPNIDVDFTTVSGVKAYIGSMFNRQTGVLTMTRAYDVPAGTGLMLKGEPGTYSIPTCESFTVVSNLLKGVTEATNINATEDGYVNYVLNNGNQGVGFYKVGTAGASLEAGRAYLQIPAETASSRSALKLRFDDEDEATGISASLTNSEERIVNSAVYDLQGRRVEQPQRGLYIRNGKKVIIK